MVGGNKMNTIKVMAMSFLVALYMISIGLRIAYEPKERPSWYGTYYSFQDAMEDGWYEND